MFGYIRPFKPQMKMYEFELYKAVYCGLCRELAAFGYASRLTLSYDFTFLALLHLAVNGEEISIKDEACAAHGFKKIKRVGSCEALNYAAATACMSTYHKLLDDRNDEQNKKKIAAAGLLPSMKKPYIAAGEKYPELAQCLKENMERQRALEEERCFQIDKAAEPTAVIMSHIAKNISQDETTRRILERMGYLLGRYIYITDALDDVEDDQKSGGYNPFLLQKNDDIDFIREVAKESVYLTLGELSNAYMLLDVKQFGGILDNVIYTGLKKTFDAVLSGNSPAKKRT